jgi:hypothetical protein
VSAIVTGAPLDLQQIFSDDEDDEEGLVDWEDWGEEETEPTVTKDSGDAAYTTTVELGMLSGHSLGSDLIETELFDSGASWHMSGYRHRFINFTNIEAKPITAADKWTFHATGKGDMIIEWPEKTKRRSGWWIFACNADVLWSQVHRISVA